MKEELKDTYIPRIIKAFFSMKNKGASNKPQPPIPLWLSVRLVTQHIQIIYSPKPRCKGWLLKGNRWSMKGFYIHHSLGVLLSHGSPLGSTGLQEWFISLLHSSDCLRSFCFHIDKSVAPG